MKTKILGIQLSILLLMGCHPNENKSGFYDYSRIDYIYRLPLLNPYELQSPDNGMNWSLRFKTNNPPAKEVQFLKKVGIIDSVIVVYSPRDLSFSSDHPEIWGVIDLKANTELVFTNESSYKKHLQSNHVERIEMYEIDKVFKVFDNNRNLPPEWLLK